MLVEIVAGSGIDLEWFSRMLSCLSHTKLSYIMRQQYIKVCALVCESRASDFPFQKSNFPFQKK